MNTYIRLYEAGKFSSLKLERAENNRIRSLYNIAKRVKRSRLNLIEIKEKPKEPSSKRSKQARTSPTGGGSKPRPQKETKLGEGRLSIKTQTNRDIVQR